LGSGTELVGCFDNNKEKETMNKVPANSPDIEHAFHAINEIQNRFDAYAFLKDFSRIRGYKYFSVLHIPPEDEQKLRDQFLITNWPEEFVREYDELNLLVSSPTAIAVRRSVRPFVWEIEQAAARRQQTATNKASELFRRHGFSRGLHVPVHDKRGQRGTVSFSGERPLPSINETGQLTLVSIHLFDRLGEIAGESKAPVQEVKLSERERQCLVWTAAGKTSAEIAAILSLSEHTVNQYITTSCQKLGTVNRAQAVAHAIRRKIID
jgi:DNA-binding CsgD family transcriptional regulator